MKQLIKAPVSLPAIELTQDMVQARDQLVARHEVLPVVADADSLGVVTEYARTLHRLCKEADEAEAALRAPVNDWLARVRKTLNDYKEPMLAVIDLRKREVGAFQEAERVRVEKERAEQERKQREAIEAAEKAKADAEAAAAKVRGEKTLAKAIQAEEAAKTAEVELLKAQAAPAPVAAKAAGVTSKREVAWEVTDIHALYKARPELVTLEPNRAAIRALIKDADVAVPGMKLRWVNATSFRR